MCVCFYQGVLSGLYSRLDDLASECDWSNPDTSHERGLLLQRCRGLYAKSRDALLGNGLAVGTPYMKNLECLALNRIGERSTALVILRKYWAGMIKSGATTFFEAFEEDEMLNDVAKFYDRPFGRSLCHAWGAGPCALLPEILLGLRPLSDGWGKWICDPLDCVTTASAIVETVHGVLEVRLDSVQLRVVVPEGTTMILMNKIYSSGRYSIHRKNLISSYKIQQFSKKYRGWIYHAEHIISPSPDIPGYDGIQMTDVPTIYQLPGQKEKFYMSFIGFDGIGYQTFVAESNDLLEWTKFRLAMGYGEEGMFDHGGVVLGAYLYDSYDVSAPRILKKIDGKFYSLYGAYAKKGTYEPE